MWDKLKTIYEGDHKVKEAKLYIFRAKFTQLKMNEDENITAYFLRVNEIVNSIKGLGDEIKEQVIVKNALRSLPMRFDSKISALEERENLDKMFMDELHGILTTCEMRIEQENTVTKEETFNASKKTKNKDKQKPKSDCSCNNDSEEDEEVSNFVGGMKKGTNKYKGMLPMKCFNCDGVGNFSNKCPYKKKKGNEEDDSQKKKKIQKGRRNKKIFFEKSICTKEDSSSSDEDEVSDSGT
jgi:hypothetical protein